MSTQSIVIVGSLFVFAVVISPAQTRKNGALEDTLAMVDSRPITTRDLFERLELMPFGAKLQDHDFESVKRKAVESLVAEKLLALSFKKSEFPDQAAFDRFERVLEKMFIRDEMYKKLIRDRVVVEPREIAEGLRRYPIKRRMLVFPCVSRGEAEKLAGEWRRTRKAGVPDSAFFSSVHREPDTLLISFGSADPNLENAAYSLKDALAVGGPVETGLYGTLVFSLVKDELNAEAATKSLQDRREAVKRVVSDRKEGVLAMDYVDKILRGNRMEADTGIFLLTAKKCWQSMCADSGDRRIPGGYPLTQDDVSRMTGELGGRLESPIARGSFGILTLGDFLENLKFYNFTVPSLKPREFMASFFGILKKIVENEILAGEGIRRGYQTDPNVIADETQWSDYWKARQTALALPDTSHVQDWEPVWSLWRYNTAFVESTCVISVQELLRPDSLSSANLLSFIRAGANLDSLVRLYSIREEWKGVGGRSGWFRFWDHPQIAVRALAMNVGDVAGPVRLEEGYSDFRLLGRRLQGDTAGLYRMLEVEARRVEMTHRQALVSHYIAREALSRRVDIFYDRIKDADIENVNMVTRHMIGFGGRMNAAPVLVPQWEWVGEWNKQRRVFQ